MPTLVGYQRQLESARKLESVVTTMKTLAAVSIRHYERAVDSLAEYNQAIERGLQIVLRDRPEELVIESRSTAAPTGVIVFGSDQGLCGPFNDRSAERAVAELNRLGDIDRTVLAIGKRAKERLQHHGQRVGAEFSLPSSLEAITPHAQELVLRIEAWRVERNVERVMLVHNRPTSGMAYRPHVQQILPVDPDWLRQLRKRPWPSRTVPTFTMGWDRLFSSLIRQHLFASIYRAFAESLAAENASRLQAMQAAERNIEDRIDQLTMAYHRTRQAAITEELLDIAAGFEALTESDT